MRRAIAAIMVLTATSLAGPAHPLSAQSEVRALEMRSLGHIGGSITSLARSGDYGYAVAGRRLLVLDLSDTKTIERVGDPVELPETGKIVVGDGWLYLVEGRSSAEGGVQLIDISIPERPILRGRIGLEGSQSDAAAIGSSLFVSSYPPGGPWIVDMADPDNPFERGRLNLAGRFGLVESIGGRLIASRWQKPGESMPDGALIVVDVDDPNAPRITAELPLRTIPRGFVTEGSRALIDGRAPDDEFGLLAIDFSDVDRPTIAGFFPVRQAPTPIRIDGDTAWGWQEQLTPWNPPILRRIHLEDWPNITYDEPQYVRQDSRESIIPHGDRMLVAGGYRGLHSLGKDGLDVAVIPTLGEAGLAAVAEGRLWAADTDGELW